MHARISGYNNFYCTVVYETITAELFYLYEVYYIEMLLCPKIWKSRKALQIKAGGYVKTAMFYFE